MTWSPESSHGSSSFWRVLVYDVCNPPVIPPVINSPSMQIPRITRYTPLPFPLPLLSPPFLSLSLLSSLLHIPSS